MDNEYDRKSHAIANPDRDPTAITVPLVGAIKEADSDRSTEWLAKAIEFL